MIVRCGRCATQFEVAGPGRHSCPACGTANEVGGGVAPTGPITAPPTPTEPPAEVAPPGRAVCPGCEWSFFVGEVDTARCPNCGDEVTVSPGGE